MQRQHRNEGTAREIRQRRRKRELQRKVFGFCLLTFLLGVLCGKLVFAKEKGTEETTTFFGAFAKSSEDEDGTFAKNSEDENGTFAKNDTDGNGAAGEAGTTDGDDWKLTLVNKSHFMEEDYEPVLAEIENNYYFDIRAVESLKEMLAVGRKEGLDFWICSAYRTNEKQTQLFENKVNRLMAEGLSYNEAYEEAKTVVAFPGTSEHQLGWAVDIVAKDYQQLDEKQARTDEAKWLAERCWEYGFILRYPVDKTEETGIIFEPWHYRYVGEEAAKEITEQGICLEEYLGAV